MDVLIRPVQPDDAAAIADILNPIIAAGSYTVLDQPFSVEAEREFIENYPSRGLFYVAERRADQRIVGLQDVEPFAAYTRAFDHVGVVGTFVDLAHRGQGIGTRLSRVVSEAARDMGYEKLFTYIRADNVGALVFYLKQGFRIVGTAQRQARLGGRYVDEVIVERFLEI